MPHCRRRDRGESLSRANPCGCRIDCWARVTYRHLPVSLLVVVEEEGSPVAQSPPVSLGEGALLRRGVSPRPSPVSLLDTRLYVTVSHLLSSYEEIRRPCA